MEEAVRKLLDTEPWDLHIERLTLYAHNLIRQRTWRGVRGGAVPAGMEPVDFALEAVKDLLTGKRKWDPISQPDLMKFLFDAVDSEISNAVVSKSNQDIREDPNAADTGISDDDTAFEILDLVSDDPQLSGYVEAVIDGCGIRGDIAEYINVPPTQVDNLRRRMARRLDGFYRDRYVSIRQGDRHHGN